MNRKLHNNNGNNVSYIQEQEHRQKGAFVVRVALVCLLPTRYVSSTGQLEPRHGTYQPQSLHSATDTNNMLWRNIRTGSLKTSMTLS